MSTVLSTKWPKVTTGGALIAHYGVDHARDAARVPSKVQVAHTETRCGFGGNVCALQRMISIV